MKSKTTKKQTEKMQNTDASPAIAVRCAHTRMVAVGAMKPNPRNCNRHPGEQVALLAKNIEKLGWRHPIIVSNLSGFIVAGHARLEAARVLGVSTVPVDYQDFATVEDETAYLIADNRIAELAEMDEKALGELLTELEKAGADMALTGFSDADLRELVGTDLTQGDAEPQLDNAEEINKTWKVKEGDLWLIGRHRLMCGDSTKSEDVKKVLNGNKATLVFTDPPYGVSVGKKNVMLNTFQKAGMCLTDIVDDDLTPEQLKERLLPAFRNIRELVMSDDCTVFVTAPQWGELGMMMMMMMEAKLPVRHVLIWKKDAPTFSMGRLDYDYQHEPILLTWGKRHKRPMMGTQKTSIWEISKPRSSKVHPTMKPVEIPENAMLNNSDAGDVVWDSYLGSGTTMVAAENTGRTCCGIEISPNYCAVILQRMKDAFPGIEIKRA